MWVNLTVGRNAGLVGIVRGVGRRVAECAGYDAARSDAIGAAVAEVFAAASEAAARDDGPDVDVAFSSTGEMLEIVVSGRSGPFTAGPTARAAADEAATGQTGEAWYCRLRLRLPQQASESAPKCGG